MNSTPIIKEKKKQQIPLSTILQQLQSKFGDEELREIYREFRKQLAEEDCDTIDDRYFNTLPKKQQEIIAIRHLFWLNTGDDYKETEEIVLRRIYHFVKNNK